MDEVTLEKLTETCFVLNVRGMEVAIVKVEMTDGDLQYVILSKDGKVLVTFEKRN